MTAAPALWLLGYPDQALASSQAALALAQQLAHPLSLMLALFFAAVLHHVRREVPLTQVRAEAAVTIATDQGFPQFLAQVTPLLGWARATSGYEEERMTQLQQGLATYRAANGHKGWTMGEVADQIRITREGPAPGAIHFSAKPILRNTNGVADVIRQVYARPAAVPEMPWLERKTSGGR